MESKVVTGSPDIIVGNEYGHFNSIFKQLQFIALDVSLKPTTLKRLEVNFKESIGANSDFIIILPFNLPFIAVLGNAIIGHLAVRGQSKP